MWRLIVDEPKDAFTNMAIDEAILKSNKKPTLRLYSWIPSAISIGYFQSMKEEVDIERCDEEGIDYVRRITGGGAVFHHKELTYSITVPIENRWIPENLNRSYEKICGFIIHSLKTLNIKAEYAPLNDIITNGKKISGCAQTRKNNILLQHGTMILDVDIGLMFSILKIPDEKLKGKLIKKAEERVTSLKKELGRDVSFDEMKDAMVNGFTSFFGEELKLEKLSEEEKKLAEEIRKEKFSKREWNFKR